RALQGAVGVAMIVAGVGVAGRQPQSLVVCAQCLLVAPQVLQRGAAAVMQGRIVGLDVRRLGVVAERQFVPAFLGVGARALQQRRKVVGVGGERLSRLGDLTPRLRVRL